MNYYLFATYLFVLVCIIIIICKYLFADVKRQRRMLDEKEKQLLDTYRTLEDAMDDYYVLVEDAREELEEKSREFENLMLLSAPEPELPEINNKPAKAAKPKKTPAKKPAKAPDTESQNGNQLGFEQLFSDAVANVSTKAQTHEKILEMSKQGKSRSEIAKALQITQSEVELVTGMNKEQELPETHEKPEPEKISEDGQE